MGNSTIIWQFCCVVDIISSHITKFFQIWLTVAGYDELCVGFYISQLEMGKYFECLSNNISIVKLILIFSLKGVLFPCSSNTLTRIRCNQWRETKKNYFSNLFRTWEPSTYSLFSHIPSTGCLGQTPLSPLLNVYLKFCCHKSHCIPDGILTYTLMVLLSIKLCRKHRSTHNIKFMKMDQFTFVQKMP